MQFSDNKQTHLLRQIDKNNNKTDYFRKRSSARQSGH